ncbi:hypothetical protein ACUNHV_25930, partial [Serratia sp. IR-2025]
PAGLTPQRFSQSFLLSTAQSLVFVSWLAPVVFNGSAKTLHPIGKFQCCFTLRTAGGEVIKTHIGGISPEHASATDNKILLDDRSGII